MMMLSIKEKDKNERNWMALEIQPQNYPCEVDHCMACQRKKERNNQKETQDDISDRRQSYTYMIS